LHAFAKPACLKGFQFCRLPGIAGCCVRVRVKLGSRRVGRYSFWIPSTGRHAAGSMDEALG
jgi:hypothetical protein